MGMQGEPEPAGCAKITLGYNLPAKYVIHTVGPMVGVKPTETDARTLRNCYVSCLEKAREMNLKSIAFCCISTGVYGYPQKEACALAVRTVKARLAGIKDGLKVIFDVFTEEDEALYERELFKKA